MSRAFLPALALLSIALAGCDRGPEPEPQASQPAKAGIAVSKARVVLPAVTGNPGAAYFDLANNTEQAIVLSTVEVAGAERTEMHETKGTSMAPVAEIAVAPGQSASFAPGGSHVMVFGAPSRSAAGETRALTLKFKDGRSVQVEARLEAIGGDAMGGDAMGEMDHTGASH